MSDQDPVTPPVIDLLFTGAIFCDLVFAGVTNPEAGTEVYADGFAISPGGAANPAVAAARLRRRTALLSELGDDLLGSTIRGSLAREDNLDLGWIAERHGYQTPVTAAMTGPHDRRFVTYAEDECNLDWPVGAPTVGAAHVSVDGNLRPWVRRLRDQGTMIYGGVGWDESGLWSSGILDRLEQVDVFVPNDLEAMNYTRCGTAADAARKLGEYVELAVVTRGRDGVIAYRRSTDDLVEVPAVPTRAADPTGAGDVFVAALMASYDYNWELDQRLRLANLCAALSVQSLGGARSAPTLEDLRRYLGSSTIADQGLLADGLPEGDEFIRVDWTPGPEWQPIIEWLDQQIPRAGRS
ncbi:carbohydrate kinase [Microlunatus endophyticus]|uniref:Carbohydrate kinase n=1 Tax=Microlunatus endophyticus TaxID=1716077 RepID=A0A917SFR6_9ACTN|nr:PfkB family carbohydrate kinase [Microlunatus endophyticus]GGL78415.1 carbohydrate kinase [Microlunatus endophyticus]